MAKEKTNTKAEKADKKPSLKSKKTKVAPKKNDDSKEIKGKTRKTPATKKVAVKKVEVKVEKKKTSVKKASKKKAVQPKEVKSETAKEEVVSEKSELDLKLEKAKAKPKKTAKKAVKKKAVQSKEVESETAKEEVVSEKSELDLKLEKAKAKPKKTVKKASKKKAVQSKEVESTEEEKVVSEKSELDLKLEKAKAKPKKTAKKAVKKKAVQPKEVESETAKEEVVSEKSELDLKLEKAKAKPKKTAKKAVKKKAVQPKEVEPTEEEKVVEKSKLDLKLEKIKSEKNKKSEKKKSSQKNKKSENNEPDFLPAKKEIERNIPKIIPFVGTNINPEMLLSPFQKIDKYYKQTLGDLYSFLSESLYVDSKVSILLCVSGGIDSVVMLDKFANLAREKSWALHIAHFNHRLRKESDEDEYFVEELAEKYNIPFYRDEANVKKYARDSGYSIEEAARRKRYFFFEQLAKSIKVNFVATAHNANDSTETFFINLMRGSGLTGLGGIPQKRPLYKNINVIRPLIHTTRKEIEEYASKRNIKWREDKTNSDRQFLRNKIRLDLIPFIEKQFNKDIISVVNRSAHLISSADRFVYSKVRPDLDKLILSSKKSYVIIDANKLELNENFIKGELISLILERYFNISDVTYNKIKNIISLLNQGTGKTVEISKLISVVKDRMSLVFYKNRIFDEKCHVINNVGETEYDDFSLKLSKVKPKDVDYGQGRNIEYFDMEYMPDKFELRTIRDGDRFRPIGFGGTVKLSDFVVNNKIPFAERKNLMVLTDKVNIIWVCGWRISERYKVKSDSKKILRAEMIMLEN
jgi:tRNA(Ile)-lysidine synthase